MEPAYWEMRRIAQNVQPTTPDAEYDRLEVSPLPVSRPPMENDPDAPIYRENGGIAWLSPECGRVIPEGRWRILRPLAPA